MRTYLARTVILHVGIVLSAATQLFAQTCPINGTVNVNFDSFSLAPGTCADPTTFFSDHGIMATTPGAVQFGVCRSDSTAPALRPFFAASNGNAPVTWTLTFCTPLDIFGFTRLGYAADRGGPAWTAQARNSTGEIVATVGEGGQFASPATTFVLPGPGISSVTFIANDPPSFTTFGGPPIVDLVLSSNCHVNPHDVTVATADDGTAIVARFTPAAGLSAAAAACGVTEFNFTNRVVADPHPPLSALTGDLGGQLKTGNLWTGQNRQFRAAETSEFYFVPFSVRKSVCTLVRQLRGPHLSTCA